MSFLCCESNRKFSKKQSKKRSKFFDVVAIVKIRRERRKFQRHLYIIIVLQFKNKSIYLQTMINNETIRNFLFQLKMQELRLSSFIEIKARLCTMNETSLHVYEKHDLKMNVTNEIEKIFIVIQQLIDANIKNVDMILKLS